MKKLYIIDIKKLESIKNALQKAVQKNDHDAIMKYIHKLEKYINSCKTKSIFEQSCLKQISASQLRPIAQTVDMANLGHQVVGIDDKLNKIGEWEKNKKLTGKSKRPRSF